MDYKVFYGESVRRDIARIAEYLRVEGIDKVTMENWFDRLFESINSLETLPRRYPIAQPESAQLGIEVRKLVHGKYLIFYTVDEAERSVHLLAIVHGAVEREDPPN